MKLDDIFLVERFSELLLSSEATRSDFVRKYIMPKIKQTLNKKVSDYLIKGTKYYLYPNKRHGHITITQLSNNAKILDFIDTGVYDNLVDWHADLSNQKKVQTPLFTFVW